MEAFLTRKGRNMPRSPIEEYRLSPKLLYHDLSGIWDYTAEMWSPDHPDAYLRLGDKLDVLCSHPEIARERTEIDPPVRLHPYRSHLIIYRIEGDHLVIIRVVHSRQHWQALLSE